MELNEISEFRNLDLKDIRALNLKPPHELLEVLKNYEVQKGLAHIFDGYEPGICLSEPVSRRLSLVDEESLVSGVTSEASAVPMQNEYTQPNDESSETPVIYLICLGQIQI